MINTAYLCPTCGEMHEVEYDALTCCGAQKGYVCEGCKRFFGQKSDADEHWKRYCGKLEPIEPNRTDGEMSVFEHFAN